ncbi:HK97 gp10 family phage protein [Pseudomonas luteola]|uniref:HK97 gp10 family phage protein n=1 Tax=Pseudomonas luteola TaxID=47886 RepID=UPI003A878BC6
MARQNSFALDVRAFVERTKEKQDEVFRSIVIEIARSIITMSPVDTGRFRANWQFQVDRVPAGTLEAFDQSAQGAQTIAKIVNETVVLKVGDVAYIANNLPYSIALEYGLYPNPPKKGTGKTVNGFSTQAKQGMVRITVERFQSIVREELAKHKL